MNCVEIDAKNVNMKKDTHSKWNKNAYILRNKVI